MKLTLSPLGEVCLCSNVRAVSIDFSGTLTAPPSVMHPALPWRAYLDELVNVGRTSNTAAEICLPTLLRGEDRAWAACIDHGASYSIEQILQESGVPLVSAAMEAFRQTFVQHMLVTPSARAAVQALHRAGLAVGLLSNSIWPKEWFTRTLTEQGLIGEFDAIVVSSGTPYCKPNAEFFRQAMAELKSTTSDTVHIGDRVFEDICGARQAGIRAVHFGELVYTPEVTDIRCMTDWVQIADVLESWSVDV